MKINFGITRKIINCNLKAVLSIALPAVLIILTAVFLEPGQDSSFDFNLGETFVKFPVLTISTSNGIYFFLGLCLLTGILQLKSAPVIKQKSVSRVLPYILIASIVISLLILATSGKKMNITGLLQSTFIRAVPLTLGALGAILCDRSGVMYIGLEGVLLIGAFVGAVAGSAAMNSWIGLLAAIAAGGLISLFYAVLVIRYQVDQIIAGMGINILSTGITSFLMSRVLSSYPELNAPNRFLPIHVPGLSDLPIIGPVLFGGNFFVYLTVVLVFAINFLLFKTRWGLRSRAVGEHPKAADTLGVRVHYVRYVNVVMGGMVAGIGGAYLTLGSTGGFDRIMTAGRGYISLASMIFGGFAPIGTFLASLVFGMAEAIQTRFSILNVPIPSQFLQMLPYILTVVVVAGFVGRVRSPAAEGKPYIKDH